MNDDRDTDGTAPGQTEPVAAPVLYKATVALRWRNSISHEWNDVVGGQVVDFDEGDFGDRRSLTSLEDVLERGAFVVFDPARARDVSYMSRDEMIEILVAAGKGEDLSPQARDVDLAPLVQAHLDAEDAAKAEAS